MDQETEQFLKQVRESEFISDHEIDRLRKLAGEFRKKSPRDCLRILQVLAQTMSQWRAASDTERLFAYQEASDFGWDIDEPSAFIDAKAAEFFASQGNHANAGLTFERASKSWEREYQAKAVRDPKDWRQQSAFLREAESHFSLAALPQCADRVRYEKLKLHRDREPSLAYRARSWFFWAVWGWGERPWRVAGHALALILLYALGFWASGVTHPPGSPKPGFGDCLYLSVVTFTTLGYGDYLPASGVGKLLSGTEALLGVLFTGMFLVTFVKKYSG